MRCVQQRNLLSALKDQDDLLLELFEWYGSYLLWFAPHSVMVVHLRGRHFDPVMDQAREQERERDREQQRGSASDDDALGPTTKRTVASVDEGDGRVDLYDERLDENANHADES